MAGQHTTIWSCHVTGHEDIMFLSELGLQQHILEEHSKDIPADHITAVVSMGKRPMPDVFAVLAAQQLSSNKDSACPLCNESSTTIAETKFGTVSQFPPKTYNEVKNHLADHLETIALLSLPGSDESRSDFNELGSLPHEPVHTVEDFAGMPEPVFEDSAKAMRLLSISSALPAFLAQSKAGKRLENATSYKTLC
jgi:hypothetical protein